MIEIYGTPNCAACKQAVALCEQKGLEYEYFDLTNSAEIMAGMLDRIGSFKTVPQIIVDGEYVGGLDKFKERI